MIPVGRTRSQRFWLGVALLAVAAFVTVFKVITQTPPTTIEAVLAGGLGIGGFALIDPALAKDLLNRARRIIRRNGS